MRVMRWMVAGVSLILAQRVALSCCDADGVCCLRSSANGELHLESIRSAGKDRGSIG